MMITTALVLLSVVISRISVEICMVVVAMIMMLKGMHLSVEGMFTPSPEVMTRICATIAMRKCVCVVRIGIILFVMS